MYITMYGSDDGTSDNVAIPSVYVTMAGGKELLEAGEIDVEVRAVLRVLFVGFVWYHRRF